MKKYSLMIEADSAQELAQALSEAHMELGGSQQIALPAQVLNLAPKPVVPIQDPELKAINPTILPEPPVEKVAAAVKKEKAKKAKEVEAVEEKSVISASALKAEKAAPDPFGEQEAPAAPTPAITFDDVKNALKKLIEKFDIDTAVHFLETGWKISKITALQQADYEGFMAALEAKLKA